VSQGRERNPQQRSRDPAAQTTHHVLASPASKNAEV
jgi:hypothetical protein